MIYNTLSSWTVLYCQKSKQLRLCLYLLTGQSNILFISSEHTYSRDSNSLCIGTVMPVKSDSDVVFCFQLLSKTLT